MSHFLSEIGRIGVDINKDRSTMAEQLEMIQSLQNKQEQFRQEVDSIVSFHERRLRTLESECVSKEAHEAHLIGMTQKVERNRESILEINETCSQIQTHQGVFEQKSRASGGVVVHLAPRTTPWPWPRKTLKSNGNKEGT